MLSLVSYQTFKLIKNVSCIITKSRKIVNDLDYADIKFPVSKKDYSEIEQENSICVNAFCYENDFDYPIQVSDKKFEKWYGFIVDNRLK